MEFNKHVKLIVEPVLIFFGFRIKKEMKGIVEYDFKNLSLSISYDYNSSYEVDITLIFKENNAFYGYDELKEYFKNQKYNHFATQIVNEDFLIKWLEGVKIFLNENLKNIIENPRKVQIGLEKIRQCRSDIYEKERDERILSENVNKYWMNKDYSGLVELLKNYKGTLEEIIMKKYEYALKMNKK